MDTSHEYGLSMELAEAAAEFDVAAENNETQASVKGAAARLFYCLGCGTQFVTDRNLRKHVWNDHLRTSLIGIRYCRPGGVHMTIDNLTPWEVDPRKTRNGAASANPALRDLLLSVRSETFSRSRPAEPQPALYHELLQRALASAAADDCNCDANVGQKRRASQPEGERPVKRKKMDQVLTDDVLLAFDPSRYREVLDEAQLQKLVDLRTLRIRTTEYEQGQERIRVKRARLVQIDQLLGEYLKDRDSLNEEKDRHLAYLYQIQKDLAMMSSFIQAAQHERDTLDQEIESLRVTMSGSLKDAVDQSREAHHLPSLPPLDAVEGQDMSSYLEKRRQSWRNEHLSADQS